MTKTSKRDADPRMERFAQACRNAGIKLTHQRIEIFREVAQAGDHPDADTVLKRVRERLATVSLDTVYRTLWLLNDLALVNTLGPHRERTRFDANLDQHHHFVCIRCGSTQDFYSEALNEIRLPKTAKAFGQVETTHVEVRGVCRGCVGKKKTKRSRTRNKEAKP